MTRLAVAAVFLVAAAWPALAQQTTASPVAKLLQDDYDIKAAFSDNQGGAYLVLEKGQSAYLCHSNPTQTCSKLN